MKNNVLMGQFRNLHVACEDLAILAAAASTLGIEKLAGNMWKIQGIIKANLNAVSTAVAQEAYKEERKEREK